MLKAMGSSYCIALMGLFLYYREAICPGLLRTEGFPRTKDVIMHFYVLHFLKSTSFMLIIHGMASI